MAYSVIVFSADDIRGKILNKVLSRTGVECHIFNQILEAGRAIARHAPQVVIFDTEGCFAAEINHLKKICRTLKHPLAFVLGEAGVINGFKGRKTLCFSDPIDPDLIAAKAKEIISQKKKSTVGGDTLEKTLKKFLKFD